MFTLIYKEVTQLRSHLAQTLGLLAALLILSAKFVPTLGITYALVFPIVSALTLPQISFAQEERGNTLVFLRSLPIQPGAIVGSKYVLSILVTVAFAVVVLALGPFPYLGSPESLTTISAVVFLSLFLASVSLLLHFWLGLKSAKTALLVTSFLSAIPTMLLFTSAGNAEILAQRFADLAAFVSTPTGAFVIVLAGLLVMAGSWAISTAIFAKRDTSQMV